MGDHDRLDRSTAFIRAVGRPSLTYSYIYLTAIYVDFLQSRPTSDLELVLKDDAGAKHKSYKFKKFDPGWLGDYSLYWILGMYVRAHTSATLTIQRALFKRSVAEIKVEFKPNVFGDGKVRLEDSNHRFRVTFVCGRSQYLSDVTRVCVFGYQARTSLASKILRFLKFPQPAVHLALPPPTSKRGYDVLHADIPWLNDRILLCIFNCYRLDDTYGWNLRLRWYRLSQVCQRWRHLIYQSTFQLGIHTRCTNGTLIVDPLDHLPSLPLLVDYRYPITEQDASMLSHVLRLHDRVCHIYLHLPPSILHKFLLLMDEHFPILEHLSLWFVADKFTTLTLPKAFLAPNLRHLTLPGISPSKRLRLLTSTVSLVTIMLWDIQASGYFRPRLLAARVWSLPQLEELSIGFSIPIPRPDTERELLGEHGRPVTLPNLKTLRFQGVSAYLESLVAQIRTPLLKRLQITLFHQLTFPLPHLSHFITTTEGLKFPAATVSFGRNEVYIFTGLHSSLWSDAPFFLCVKGKQLDWQIGCAAQICGSLIRSLSDVERLALDIHDVILPKEWLNGEIDARMWHKLLRSFIGVKELYIWSGLLEELSRALQVDKVGSDPEFLTILKDLVTDMLSSADNPFASFIHTRRVAGRPVRFSRRPL